jgi:hypothetical protein
MKKVLLGICLVVILSNVANAVLLDSFEDGDTVNNPTWNVTNSSGAHSITEDP